MFSKAKIKRKWLNIGTVPMFKMHHVGTDPTFKMHLIGTVPTFKKLNIGILTKYLTEEGRAEGLTDG